jgi:hypothetical protein
MLETDPSFRPVRVREGYPPLEDLGLIGDRAKDLVPLLEYPAGSGGPVAAAGSPP